MGRNQRQVRRKVGTVMACLCGDTMCPSCGAAMGAPTLESEIVFDMLWDITNFKDIDGMDAEYIIAHFMDAIGTSPGVVQALETEARNHAARTTG